MSSVISTPAGTRSEPKWTPSLSTAVVVPKSCMPVLSATQSSSITKRTLPVVTATALSHKAAFSALVMPAFKTKIFSYSSVEGSDGASAAAYLSFCDPPETPPKPPLSKARFMPSAINAPVRQISKTDIAVISVNFLIPDRFFICIYSLSCFAFVFCVLF